MAIFQPSNITPSTLSGSTGTIDASDNIAISWQVNGNSPLTAYKIDIYEGNASTTTYTTGKVTGDSQLPFYGKDEKGNYIQFIPELTGTWASAGLSNGKNYRMKITQYWNNGSEQTVNQYSETAFITRANPTLAITAISGGTVTMVAYAFTATYVQANGDVIKWVRWKLTNNTADTVIEDTGHIDTPVLEYTYSGFLNGNNYTIYCEVETENGVTVSDTETFDVVYAEDTGTGSIQLQCTDDNAVLLSWAEAMNIPGVCSPSGAYSITDNVLSLNSGATVTWDTVDGDAMAFTDIYSLAGKWKNKPTVISNTAINNFQYSGYMNIQFDNQGENVVVISRYSTGIYQYSNGTFTQIQGIANAYNCAISPDGTKALFIYNNSLDVYTISGTTATKIATVSGNNQYTLGFIDNTHFFASDANDVYTLNIYTITGSTVSAGTANVTGVGFTSSVKNNCVADSTGSYIIARDVYRTIIYSVSGETLTEEYTFIPSRSTSIFTACDFVMIDGVEHFAMVEYDQTYIESKVRIHEFDDNKANFGSWVLQRIITDYISEISGDDGEFAVAGSKGVYLYTVQLYNSAYAIAEAYETTFINTHYQGYCCIIPTQGALAYGWANTGATMQLAIFDTALYNILSVSDGNSNTITIGKQKFDYIISHQGSPSPVYRTMPNSADSVFINLAYDKLQIWGFTNGVIGNGSTLALSTPSQMGIESIVLYGEQECEYLYITTNTTYNYSARNYIPAYDGNTLFYASFADDLQAGTLSSSGATTNVIYRLNNNELLPIATLPTTVNQVKDFGVLSNQLYGYSLYYLNNGVYSSAISSDGNVCRQLKSYTLMEGVQDTTYPDTYHVINTWIFGNNIDMGGVSNGNNPTLQANFTKYPYRQNNSQAPKSGTLQALLSNVKDGQYADTAEQQERLFAISQSTNDFFLKDMKGNIYQVHTSAPITQTQNTKTAYLETTVSVPWTEVGDASNVSLIQTPSDSGWDNTNTQSGGVLRTQSKTVPLLMPTTDMTITPDSGYLLSSVIILKPNTLQPSTIKKDVDIGGIVGTYEAQLQNKTVSSSYVSQTITPDNGYDGMANVTINPIDTDVLPSDYNFYDYDGTLLYSYSTAELGALTELPPTPEHNGLTSQGWNWTLAQLQALTYPMDVSAIYYPDDGKTRLYINIPYDNYTMTNYIYSQNTVINWGDGNTYTDTTSGNHTVSHTYASKGKYVVTYEIVSGLLRLGQSGTTLFSADTSDYAANSILTRLILGTNTLLTSGATTNCSLNAISPNPPLNGVGAFSFGIADTNVPFVGFIPTTYNNSLSVTNGNVTTISVPYRTNNQTLTATGTNIKRICLSPNTTTIPNSAFAECHYLTDVHFNKCSIGSNAFKNCYSLNYLKLNTGFVYGAAFTGCSGVKYFDFTPCTTVPTLQNSNAFSGTTGQIIVPDSLYSTWIAASQWSNLSSRIIKESDL